MQAVPATTRIRTSRTRFIEDERLLARLDYLRQNLNGHVIDSRYTFKKRVTEAIAIERELRSRHIPFNRVTRGPII